MTIEIRLLTPGESRRLEQVAADVFDEPIDPALAATFLCDPRHHLVVAIDKGVVVGFVSAVHYLHPDKPLELWINEVGVAPSHQGQGIGRALVQRMLEQGSAIGCVQAWVLTEPGNVAARALYRSAGGTEAPAPSVLIEFPLVPR